MSRLIVKNLPNNITSDKLRSLFSQKGEITDVQLKYTKEGKFRNFGFIGYKTDEFASSARDFFNGTCIKTNRITVETCVPLGNATKPKAWSKYAPDSTNYKKIHHIEETAEVKLSNNENKKQTKDEKRAQKEKEKRKMIKQILKKHKDDPMFAEFLEVHAPKGKKSMWGNDAENEEDNILNNLSSSDDEDNTEEKAEDKYSVEKDSEAIENETETKKMSKKENKKLANEAISDLEYMKSLMKKDEKKKSKKSKEVGDGASEDEEQEAKEDAKNSKKKKEPRNRVLYFVKLHDLPFSCKKRDVKDFFKPLIPFTIRIPRPTAKVTKGFCYVGFRSEEERKKALFKNKSIMTGRRIIVSRYDNQRKLDEDVNEGVNIKHKNQEESLKNEENIAESGKIYVRNLPYVCSENEIQELFEKFGPVTEVNMPVDKITHQPKGFCHITYMMPEHAVKAFTELDGSIFCGRMMHLLPGKQKQEQDPNEEGLTYKQKKERKQKQQSGSSHNWNTLFLGANAVADVVADEFHTTKEKLLEGNEKTSGAVRLALGETQLVLKTKKFLEENGVSLDAFNQPPTKRSKTVILVKNMPAKSSYNEVLKLFEPFGLISRLVMPPHGITALIEFVEPSEARKAFTKLAYSQFKYLPLYLEWAPDNVFKKPADPNITVNKVKTEENEVKEDVSMKKNNVKEVVEEVKVEEVETKEQNEIEAEDEDDLPEENTTLFVKGLNFETRDDNLKKHFSKCGRIYSTTVAMKKDPHNAGKLLSMGYGFVQFYSKNSVEKALKDLQFSTLDEKQVELKRSERTGAGDVRTTRKQAQIKKQTGTKILVRNIPFQANQREVQEIFRVFGEIKALRMPKKMQPGESQHRGFCFVEYYNKGDAKNGFQALCQSTHLYGRRLVLEWANVSDDNEMIDVLRKRTSELFYQDTPGGKKTRKSKLEAEEPEEDEN